MGVLGRLLNFPGVREARLYASLLEHRPLRSSAPALFAQGARAVRSQPTAQLDQRLLVVTRSTVWLRLCLALSPLFVERGSQVDLLVVPYDDRLVPGLVDDYYRLRAARRVLPKTPSFRLLFNDELPAQPLAADALRVVEEQSLLDAKVLLKREGLDIEGDDEHRHFYETRLARNRELAEVLEPLLATGHYDNVLVPDGTQWEHGTAFRIAGLRGVQCVTFDFSEIREHAIVTLNGTFAHMPIDAYWALDEPHVLTPTRRDRVERFVRERDSADWKTLTLPFQLAEATTGDAARAAVGLRPSGPVALLCTNLVSEAYYMSGLVDDDEARAFPTMSEWVTTTVERFLERPDWELVIRAHPWERKQLGTLGIASVIESRFGTLPDHIHVVGPSDPVSTYSLMNAAAIGFAYRSTTGLEMAMRRVTVVTAGAPHYAAKGFTIDPTTEEEYLHALDSLLTDPARHRLTERQVELAWCYLDVSLLALPRPFPWGAKDFDGTYAEWPIRRCLEQEGQARFGKTLDLMRGVDWSPEGVPNGWTAAREAAQVGA